MKSLRVYIAICSLLLIVYLVAQYYKPEPTNWTPTFVRTDKIPYGTFILYQQLKDIFPQSDIISTRLPVYNMLKEQQFRSANYLIIAPRINMDQYDFGQLTAFAKAGNQVLLACFYPGSALTDSLRIRINSESSSSGKEITLNFTNPSLKTVTGYPVEDDLGRQYFSKFDTTKAIVLGVNQNGHSNLIKYEYGRGTIYLSACPLLFTNYSLLRPQEAAYVERVLSCLNPANTLIWDEYATLGNEDEQAPLRVFFKYAELRWAYYLTIFSLLAYVIYQMKRRQRIISVADPMTNTSVEFVNVVGQVYYQQRNNRNIAEKKIVYLLDHIRSAYHIKTNDINRQFAEQLMNKAAIDKELTDQLMMYISMVKSNTRISDRELIELNTCIENFYKHSR
ncbi:DUF4350 domain-containing protein (plasmid) [Pedobacter sp. BS3]|uniref:DUF4350 domain-containing protein n=1 Tax=Pedobacter sp. BS3 TaxID=2567937 RepID=UPI0011EBC454|nr:DUF4350 domain-containing protein [Pedobacter sp. BS3]TZF85663.1 DUF4350 domain-containing protein [Pedobacter sp. BS3]